MSGAGSGRIDVERPGALTTVQDLGRPGHAASGVSRGGAMDPWVARAANRAVGNADDAALLEITLAGPTLRFEGAATVALAGDRFEVELDGEPAHRGGRRPLVLHCAAGARIAIGRALAGVRSWLAIAGGIDVPQVLGSRSTDLAGAFGGVSGRALAAGDRLAIGDAAPAVPAPPALGGARASTESREGVLRVLPGPDRELVTRALDEALAAARLRVDPRSDRRGVRLTGGEIELAPHPPLRSQPVVPGTIQAPSSGELIVLGPDAPVTGGYPWIAQVIEADLGELAYLAPGASVRLELVDVATAGQALSARWRELAAVGEP